MITLRNVLKINAVSSGATGLLLLAFSGYFMSLFAAGSASPFIVAGVFLLLFSIFVMLVALQKELKASLVKSIIWMDILWVIGSLLLVLTIGGSISVVGNILIAGVALWVLAMAVLQQKGLAGEKMLQTK